MRGNAENAEGPFHRTKTKVRADSTEQKRRKRGKCGKCGHENAENAENAADWL